MIIIKIILHLLTLLAFALVSIKTYEKLVHFDMRRVTRCDFVSMKPFGKFSCMLTNRYFLGNALICLATTGSFFLMVKDLFVTVRIQDSFTVNLSRLSLLIGIYLVRGFKLEFTEVDKIRIRVLIFFKKILGI